jgi:hypothetical protein
MGVMRRTSDSNIGLVTFRSRSSSKTRISWCAKCAKVGINSPLKHRIYTNEDGSIAQVPPPDSKNWKQCWTCGEIVGVYAAQQEADIETLTEPMTNPFNNVSSSSERAEQPIRLDESRLAKHRKKKFKDDLSSQYKEQDIKDALRKGQKLVSYVET